MGTWHESLLWMSKLLLAALLGGAIGFERESHGQSAGFRTNLLVGIGSCLMMMLSLHVAQLSDILNINTPIRVDPGRIASYAIASMGFLGAGAIIKGKGTVRGLTTAAGLWMVTGIGLAVGAGFLLPAIYTTILSLLALYNLRFLKRFYSHDIYTILSLTCWHSEKPLKNIRKILSEHADIEIRFINYHHDLTTELVTYRLRLCSKDRLAWGDIVGGLQTRVPGLKEIHWEESDVP